MEFFMIMIIILILIPSIPYALILKRINTESTYGRVHKIRYREWLLLTLMPLEGLICYHLLDDFDIEKPQFDWKYFVSIISVPIIVSIYFISRKFKKKMSKIQKVVSVIFLCYGIFLCICFGIRFVLIGFYGCLVVFTPAIYMVVLAFPYYALLPVLILLVNEIYCIIKFNSKPETSIPNKNNDGPWSVDTTA